MEELDSDDTDTQGVGLDFEKENRFASDALHFTGTELAPTRVRRSYVAQDSAGSSSDTEDSDEEVIDASQIALREKEEAFVQSALRRIRRAQDKGKSKVKLNKEELDALENRRKRMQAAATTKQRKGSGSSSGSDKKRRSERNITIPLAPQEPSSRSSSRPSSSRRGSGKSKKRDDFPGNTAMPAFLVAGADGLTYAPSGSSQQTSPNRNSTSRPRASTNSQRDAQAPYIPYQPAPGNQRQVSDGMRPNSAASNKSRPMPDDENWVPSNSRRSSGASSYIVDPFEYQVSSDTPPPIPAQYMTSQPGHRTVSGPQEVSYSTVRRSIPPGASYAQPRTHLPDSFIDPNLYRRRGTRDELAEDYYSNSEDDSEDGGNGVQVFVDEREAERAVVPVQRKPVGGNEKKRRKR